MGICFLGWAWCPPGPLSHFLTLSSPAAKMPLPQTGAPGPEVKSPREPRKSQTLPVTTWKSNSMKEQSVHHGGSLRPSLGMLKQTLFRTSLRTSTHKPKEDPGLFRRSSRFLFRSLRRAIDEGLTAGHPQGPAVPEKPSKVTDGVSRQAATGTEAEDLEPQAGKVSHNTMRENRG